MVVNMHYCMNLHFFFVDVAFINFNVIIAIYRPHRCVLVTLLPQKVLGFGNKQSRVNLSERQSHGWLMHISFLWHKDDCEAFYQFMELKHWIPLCYVTVKSGFRCQYVFLFFSLHQIDWIVTFSCCFLTIYRRYHAVADGLVCIVWVLILS